MTKITCNIMKIDGISSKLSNLWLNAWVLKESKEILC